MWSDEFDKRINEAAGNDSHPYDEKSWERMELLLNKHLPQEKRRRRFIIFFLLFLLVGGASVIVLLNVPGKNKSTSVSVAEQNISTTGNTTESTPAKNSTDNVLLNNQNKQSQANNKPGPRMTEDNFMNNTKKQEKEIGLSRAEKSQKIQKEKNNKAKDNVRAAGNSLAVSGEKMQEKKKIVSLPSQKEIPATTHDNNPGEKNTETGKKPIGNIADSSPNIVEDVSGNASNKDNEKEKPVNNKLIPAPVSNDSGNLALNPAITGNIKKKDVTDSAAVDQAMDSIQTIAQIEKPKEKKGNQLILSLSGGPDISAVGTEPGKWQMQYGVGVGYAISKRFTIRTGFYVARKIYSADSNSYKAPFNVVNYYYNLDKVNGNCLVYEIPLTVVYNITTAKKHSWFVSTGLSSYLMKTEDYICTYKDPFGQTQVHNYSYDNKNSHFFSVINFSGGYQYNLTNRLSVMAEPYLKIPVAGVGIGKVKLNSAGVMFTIGYKPFTKPKENPAKK